MIELKFLRTLFALVFCCLFTLNLNAAIQTGSRIFYVDGNLIKLKKPNSNESIGEFPLGEFEGFVRKIWQSQIDPLTEKKRKFEESIQSFEQRLSELNEQEAPKDDFYKSQINYHNASLTELAKDVQDVVIEIEKVTSKFASGLECTRQNLILDGITHFVKPDMSCRNSLVDSKEGVSINPEFLKYLDTVFNEAQLQTLIDMTFDELFDSGRALKVRLNHYYWDSVESEEPLILFEGAPITEIGDNSLVCILKAFRIKENSKPKVFSIKDKPVGPQANEFIISRRIDNRKTSGFIALADLHLDWSSGEFPGFPTDIKVGYDYGPKVMHMFECGYSNYSQKGKNILLQWKEKLPLWSNKPVHFNEAGLFAEDLPFTLGDFIKATSPFVELEIVERFKHLLDTTPRGKIPFPVSTISRDFSNN